MSIATLFVSSGTLIKAATSFVKRSLINHQADILMGAGMSLGAGGVVFACKSTIEFDKKMEEHVAKLQALHDIPVEVRDGSYNNKLWKEYSSVVVDGVTTYFGASVLLGMSFYCFTKPVEMWHSKYMAEHAKHLADIAVFNRYRDFTKKELGEEFDRQAYYGLKDTKVEKTVTNEKGKPKKIKESAKIVFKRDNNGRIVIPFTQDNFGYFRNYSRFGSSSSIYNYDYLVCDLLDWNHILKADGTVILAQWLIDHKWKHPIPPEAYITVWRNEPLDGSIIFADSDPEKHPGHSVPVSYGAIDYGLDDEINADFRAGRTNECTLLLNCDLLPIDTDPKELNT